MERDKLELLLDCFIKCRGGTDNFYIAEASNPTDEIDGLIVNSNLTQDSSHFRPDYKRAGSIASSSHALAQAVNTFGVSQVGRQLLSLADQFAMIQLNNSCVKFEKSCIIVPPVEQTISVTILRSDVPEDSVTKVTWETLDKTAQSGTHYIGTSGEVVFDRGVMEKTIEIKVLPTSARATDLHFKVKLSVVDSDSNPQFMTVTLKNLDNYYEDEKQVLESLPVRPFSVEDVRSALEICLNSRTFHMALTYACSFADSLPMELAVALDLGRLCVPKLQTLSILKALENYFREEESDNQSTVD